MESRLEHTRSPRPADDPPLHRASGSRRRRGRDRRDARRIAELEAEVKELRGKMAGLEAVVGIGFHDSAEVRALRAAQHRNGGGSGFGLLHVQHESGHHVSKALLAAVRAETERLAKTTVELVSGTVLARWTMPHGVVPSLVAEHVVVPFTEPDWVVSGPGAPGAAVFNHTGGTPRGIDWSHSAVRDAPLSSKALMKLAGLAASPADVVALCNLVPYDAPWSTEFCNKFFCRLAPLATTEEAVKRLCHACTLVDDDSSDTDATDESSQEVDVRSVERFFMALVPSLTSATIHDVECVYEAFDALHGWRRPLSPEFYREFMLPLARKEWKSESMITLVCKICSTDCTESRCVLPAELPGILKQLLQSVTDHGVSIAPMASMIKCIARHRATVGLVSDVVDTVVLPLVRDVTSQYEAGWLLSTVKAIVAHRSGQGDASKKQELEQAMQTLRRLRSYYSARFARAEEEEEMST